MSRCFSLSAKKAQHYNHKMQWCSLVLISDGKCILLIVVIFEKDISKHSVSIETKHCLQPENKIKTSAPPHTKTI